MPRGKIEFEALPATDDCRSFLVRDNRTGLAPNGGYRWLRVCHRLHPIRDFSGPGLPKMQRLIQRHGGRVWAEIGLAQGAKFYFTLPQRGPESAAETTGGNQADSV